MDQQPETGWTTAEINAGSDDAAWASLEPRLRAKTITLYRPPGMPNFYPRTPSGEIVSGSISKARVRRLARDGVLVACGPETYRLAGFALRA